MRGKSFTEAAMGVATEVCGKMRELRTQQSKETTERFFIAAVRRRRNKDEMLVRLRSDA